MQERNATTQGDGYPQGTSSAMQQYPEVAKHASQQEPSTISQGRNYGSDIAAGGGGIEVLAVTKVDNSMASNGKRSKYLTTTEMPQHVCGESDGQFLENEDSSLTMNEMSEDAVVQQTASHRVAHTEPNVVDSEDQLNHDEDVRDSSSQQFIAAAENDDQHQRFDSSRNPSGGFQSAPRHNEQLQQHQFSASRHIELGDIDAESDQVLLGSALDDTRTFQNPSAQSNFQQQNSERRLNILQGAGQADLPTVEEDEQQRSFAENREQWRRDTLVDQMREDQDEDEEAQDFPIHSRFKKQAQTEESFEKWKDDPPQLADIVKDNTMSFGTGGLMPMSQMKDDVHLSEPSEDFYVNTGRSQNSYRAEQGFETEKQLPRNLLVEDASYSRERHSNYKQSQQYAQTQPHESMPPMFLADTPQSIIDQQKRAESNHSTAFAIPTSAKTLMTTDSNTNMASAKNFHQPPSSFPLVRMPPHQSASTVSKDGQSVSKLGAQTEQFLSLDHFLNDGGSQTQTPSDKLPPNVQPATRNFQPGEASMTQVHHHQTQLQSHHFENDHSPQQQQPLVGGTRNHVFNRANTIAMMPTKSPRMMSTSPLRVDPDEIKRRQMTRQQTIEMKRKQEFEELRNQAKQRELARQQKLKAAILIQKWVRGHLCRLENARMRANFRFIRKLRRMLSIAYGRKKSRFLKQLIFAMRETGKKKQKEFEEEIGNFCATLIQKIWRGYHFRKTMKVQVMREYTSKRRLTALVQGWRTRMILGRTRECVSLKRDIEDVNIQLRHWKQKLRSLNPATTSKQQHAMIKSSINQLYDDRCIKVSQLIRAVNTLRVRGKWLRQLLPQKPQQVPQNRQRLDARFQDTTDNFPISQPQPQHQQRQRFPMQQQQDHPLLNNQQQPSMRLDDDDVIFGNPAAIGGENQKFFGDEIEMQNSFIDDRLLGQQKRAPAVENNRDFGFNDNKMMMMDNHDLHDETAQNLIAHVGGGISPLNHDQRKQIQPQVVARGGATIGGRNDDDDDDQDLALLWPSQKAPKVQPIEDESLATMWPSQKKAVDDAPVMWPSQKMAAEDAPITKAPAMEPEEDDIGFMWPSQQKAKEQQNVPLRKPGLENLKQRFSAENDDDMPNDEEDIDGGIMWPTKQTSTNQRLPTKQSSKPDPKQPVMIDLVDDRKVVGGGGNVQNSIIIETKWTKNNANAMASELETAPDQKPWEDQPIKTKVTAAAAAELHVSKRQSEPGQEPLNESQSQQPPKFGLTDFEKMIEKAMQEAGEQPKGGADPSQRTPGAPQVDTNKTVKKPPAEEDPVKKKKQEAAAALLEKRKKYDPRSALKKKGTKSAAKKPDTSKPDEGVKLANVIRDGDDDLANMAPPISSRAKVMNTPPGEKNIETTEVTESQPLSTTPEQAPKPKRPFLRRKSAHKKETPVVEEEVTTSTANNQIEEESKQASSGVGGGSAAPKPFLKRKTKTMQPANTKWKSKSRIDCWGGSSNKPIPPKGAVSGSANTTGKEASPSGKSKPKTQIELQQEMEQSLPKFAENKPTKAKMAARNQEQHQKSQLDDTDFDCETVPNESTYHPRSEHPTKNGGPLNLDSKRRIISDGVVSPGDLIATGTKGATIPKGGTFAGKTKPSQRGGAPIRKAQFLTVNNQQSPEDEDDEDFDQEPVPRTMKALSQKPGASGGGGITARDQQQHATMPSNNGRKPQQMRPEMEMNYNTFSQPEFAQPSHLPDLSMAGQSLMMGESSQHPPFNQPDSHIDISEIQAQISSVMTQNDTSQVIGGFSQFGTDGQMLPHGQANLQLAELQKVFDLFHTQVEIIEEPLPQTSLARLQSREFPRPHASRTNAPQTRKVERKTVKSHRFVDIQIEEVIGQDTCIPHLDQTKSVFFLEYSPEQFEDIFEDLKGHYKKLCDEEPENMLDDDDDDEFDQTQEIGNNF